MFVLVYRPDLFLGQSPNMLYGFRLPAFTEREQQDQWLHEQIQSQRGGVVHSGGKDANALRTAPPFNIDRR